MSKIAKYNVTKDGKVQHLTITDFNDCRVQLIEMLDKYVTSTQARKVTQLLVGQFTMLHGYKISCRGKNPSFNEMRNNV